MEQFGVKGRRYTAQQRLNGPGIRGQSRYAREKSLEALKDKVAPRRGETEA
jgi:hypothetical protein